MFCSVPLAILSCPDCHGRSVAIQPDGRIPLAGTVINWVAEESYFTLVRYTADGTVDGSFGGDGIVNALLGVECQAAEVVVQPDGRIAVAGQSHNGMDRDLALAMYTAEGTPDNSFGADGKVITDIGANDNGGASLAIQADGRIVVAGAVVKGTDQDFAVSRYVSSLHIGVVEFSLTDHAPLIYPNPIAEHATLE